ncbi:MAG TPA: DUF445 family protein [Syntrophomonadaceae bacterium]|nr:DUF445 family protein [Syntrophomonadaceae bacterium]HPU48883.1 DUF445 family protein [Syntrophomonadaceae bacterium]
MYALLTLPLISALIGYITNVVAIRLLFWPKQPVNLGLFTLQGVLPKRQADIAANVGQLVEEQLLSLDEVIDQVNTPEVRERLVAAVSEVMRTKLDSMLPRIIPGKVIQLIGDTLEKVVRQEAGQIISQAVESVREYLTSEIQIKQIVEDKINQFDLDQLEEMVRGVASTELRSIEILGGVLGFIIGLVQMVIMILFY